MAREGGLSEAVEGGVGKEQNNNTGRIGPWDGYIAGGGRSWEKKPRLERRRWGLVRQKEGSRYSEGGSWKTQSFPGLNIGFPKSEGGSMPNPYTPDLLWFVIIGR